MISEIEIEKIHGNEKNPRKIDKAMLMKITESLKEAPWMLKIRPIVVDNTNMVLGGNMRLLAAKELGMKKVWCVRAEDLTEEQIKEFIIKDNLSYGEWDWDILQSDWDLEKLDEWGMDVPDFSIDDEGEEDEHVSSIDTLETDIIEGDVIEIGKHRLVCGDSTNPDHVDKCLDGESPYLMITDPPYGVEYDANWRNESGCLGKKIDGRVTGAVKNDEISDWSEAWSICPSKVAYIYHAAKFAATVQESLEKCEFEIRNQIVWVKNHFAISRGDYHWRHEPCWYAVKKGEKSNWKGKRDQDTIWEIAKNQSNETGHSTQKPVECMSKPMSNHHGDVYDPFLGSGTTMVAAHQLKRICYGIELNPKYCQIIIDRMKKLDNTLKIKINGDKV